MVKWLLSKFIIDSKSYVRGWIFVRWQRIIMARSYALLMMSQSEALWTRGFARQVAQFTSGTPATAALAMLPSGLRTSLTARTLGVRVRPRGFKVSIITLLTLLRSSLNWGFVGSVEREKIVRMNFAREVFMMMSSKDLILVNILHIGGVITIVIPCGPNWLIIFERSYKIELLQRALNPLLRRWSIFVDLRIWIPHWRLLPLPF